MRVTLEITTTALTDATGGVAYTETLVVQGGLPPYNWSLTGGHIAAGLSGPDPATGVISGTPDAACAVGDVEPHDPGLGQRHAGDDGHPGRRRPDGQPGGARHHDGGTAECHARRGL